MANAAVGRPFNVASGRGITIREAFGLIAERVNNTTGRTVSLKDVPWPTGVDAIEYRNFVGDIRALKIASGWSPLVSFGEGIDLLIRRCIGELSI